jgi:heme/copper-type cytochrome/quinol oxidase subunit 2
MCCFLPPDDQTQGQDRDHGLNTWGTLGVIIVFVAAVIAWRAWNNPSLEAMRIRGFAESHMAAMAGHSEPAKEGQRQ